MQTPASTIAEEREAAQRLVDLLTQEQAHLVDADVEALTRLTDEKARIAEQMARLSKGRHEALAAAGWAGSEAGMQMWMKNDPASAAHFAAWNGLLELAKAAKELNRVNGLLIGQHMGRTQTALNVLQGSARGGSFYGPDGQSSTKLGSRSLVVG
jgi:flagella synthesis protein FlgN